MRSCDHKPYRAGVFAAGQLSGRVPLGIPVGRYCTECRIVALRAIQQIKKDSKLFEIGT